MPSPERVLGRGGVWAVPWAAHERLMLVRQAKYDTRHITPLWYWRLLRPEDGPGATAQDETLWESPRAHRRYAAPIAVHLYADDSQQTKGQKRAVVETTTTAKVAMSRAEARRLGALLDVRDDPESLIGDVGTDVPLFIPRNEDVFRWKMKYFEVQQTNDAWLGATELQTHWEGTATWLRDDTSAPVLQTIAQPPMPYPPRQEFPAWRA